MKLKDILVTEEKIKSDGHRLSNDMIRGAEVTVSSHYYGVVSMKMWVTCCCLIHDYNNTNRLGYIIHAIAELLDLKKEDDSAFDFFKIKDIPVRIIHDGAFSKVLGFGHFMENKFVYTEDLMNLTDV